MDIYEFLIEYVMKGYHVFKWARALRLVWDKCKIDEECDKYALTVRLIQHIWI